MGKAIGFAALGLAAVLAITWIAQGNDWFMYRFFGIRYENTRRQIFEQSRAFNQGMVQELENMEVEYTTSKDPKAKEALASVILHRASGYNMDDPIVPAELRTFVQGLKDKQLGVKQ